MLMLDSCTTSSCTTPATAHRRIELRLLLLHDALRNDDAVVALEEQKPHVLMMHRVTVRGGCVGSTTSRPRCDHATADPGHRATLQIGILVQGLCYIHRRPGWDAEVVVRSWRSCSSTSRAGRRVIDRDESRGLLSRQEGRRARPRTVLRGPEVKLSDGDRRVLDRGVGKDDLVLLLLCLLYKAASVHAQTLVVHRANGGCGALRGLRRNSRTTTWPPIRTSWNKVVRRASAYEAGVEVEMRWRTGVREQGEQGIRVRAAGGRAGPARAARMVC